MTSKSNVIRDSCCDTGWHCFVGGWELLIFQVYSNRGGITFQFCKQLLLNYN